MRSWIKLRLRHSSYGCYWFGENKTGILLLSPITCFGDETYVQTDTHDRALMGLLFSYFAERICQWEDSKFLNNISFICPTNAHTC